MYSELHCHTYYSLLDGASAPEALLDRAAALGMPALAITDHDGLYGAVAFWRAARARGIRPIIGAEVTLAHGSHLTLLAETQAGYANLSRLISVGQLAGTKGRPRLTIEDVARHAGGLLCLSGCRQGAVAQAVLADDETLARARSRQAGRHLRPRPVLDRAAAPLAARRRPADRRAAGRGRRGGGWLSSPPTTSTTPRRTATACTTCSPPPATTSPWPSWARASARTASST